MNKIIEGKGKFLTVSIFFNNKFQYVLQKKTIDGLGVFEYHVL